MKKFVVSFLFLLVGLVACREDDVPMPEIPAAEEGFEIFIEDDFARVPVGPSDSVGNGSGLPLETHDGGWLKGIMTLKHLHRLPDEGAFDSGLVDGAGLPLEVHGNGGLKGIMTLKKSTRERGSSVPVFGDGSGIFWEDISGDRLPGAGVPGQVGDGGGKVVIEDVR